jgi:hypothetical protein
METTTPAVTNLGRRLAWLNRVSLGLVLMLGLLLLVVRFFPTPANFPALPRITHTRTGAAGDPLNVILVGSQPAITQSFTQTGWLVPDPITPETSARVAAASLAHQSYPTAPVSNLFVFGRAQDLAFEKPTADVQNRGHIRLWQTTTMLAGQPVWLGQASYDHGIELSGTTGLPTHHIAPTVDLERAAVGADLARTGLVASEQLAAFTPPIFVAYNGGGDYYTSDGDALVITYTPVSLPISPVTGLAAAVAGLKQGIFAVYNAILATLLLTVLAALVGVVLLALAVYPGLRWTWHQLARKGRKLS